MHVFGTLATLKVERKSCLACNSLKEVVLIKLLCDDILSGWDSFSVMTHALIKVMGSKARKWGLIIKNPRCSR